ncbi:MAG TPA: hypothetical protein VKY59_05775, partial [Spirillospora sp.]|nr:hypothetical protein [Spirillospora sp.]
MPTSLRRFADDFHIPPEYTKLDKYIQITFGGFGILMDLKKYTNKAQEALLGAQSLAVEFGHPE